MKRIIKSFTQFVNENTELDPEIFRGQMSRKEAEENEAWITEGPEHRWIDPAGGRHEDSDDEDDFEDPAAMYE